ncbi:MAG: hypothetical protein NC218_11675 [Acetobacter sp.]|nr:hypothetical protein [Acetobacter sp.]
MRKLAAIEFATIFNDYCDGVRNDTFEKICYKSWRVLDSMFKELQRKAYNPDDWYTMPLYISVTQDDVGDYGCEFYIEVISADKSIKTGEIIVPYDFVQFVAKQTQNTVIKEKENKVMMTNPNTKNDSMSAMLPAFDFGPVTGDAVRVSPYGMAIKNRDGAWVSYNAADGSVINVAGFTFDLGQMLFKVPVALTQIQKGDMVIHNRVPVYVTGVAAGGKQISVVDIREGEIKTVMPPTNMFGFNFVTKVMSLINFQTSTPDPNNPFGNIMPYIFLSSMFNSEDGESGGMGDMFKGDFGKLFMFSTMFGSGQNPFANLFGGLMPQVAPQTQPPTVINTPYVPPVSITCDTAPQQV